jgi:hypothetical protein
MRPKETDTLKRLNRISSRDDGNGQSQVSARRKKKDDSNPFKDFLDDYKLKPPLKYQTLPDLQAKASDVKRMDAMIPSIRKPPVMKVPSSVYTEKFHASDAMSQLIRVLHLDAYEIAAKVREERSMDEVADTPLRRVALTTRATDEQTAACIYFAHFTHSHFGSLHEFLSALCFSIDSRDAILRGPITIQDFLKYTNLAGFEEAAARIIYGVVKAEAQSDVIYAKDFICLGKYLEISLLDFHDWVGHLDQPPPKPKAPTYRPVSRQQFFLIWLYPSGLDASEGVKYHVKSRPASMDALLFAIQKEAVEAVPMGLRAHRLYDGVTRHQVESPSELVSDRSYLVTGAYQPDWAKFKPRNS